MPYERSELTQNPPSAMRAGGRWLTSRAARLAGVIAALAGLLLYLAGLLMLWAVIKPHIPEDISLRLFSHTLTLHHTRQKIADQALLLVLMIPLVLAVEMIFTGWAKSSARRLLFVRTPTVRMDIAYLMAGQAQLTSLLGKLMTFGISVGFGVWIHDRLSALLHFDIGLGALPYALQVAGYFWVYTFFDYWTHRLDHSRGFWPLHRFHHSSRDFCVITSLRAHPADFTALFLINLPMAILGAPVEAMITVNLIVTTIGLLIHSSIDSNWGWFGRWVIQSPNHHRLHHILDYRKNGVGHYAMAPIWDHIFGTWKGEADQSLPIGVDESYRFGYWFMHDLVRDYIDFWKALSAVVIRLVKRGAD
ncbi:MAG: sterol desaturase family protein [Asticcacaulis sp.]